MRAVLLSLLLLCPGCRSSTGPDELAKLAAHSWWRKPQQKSDVARMILALQKLKAYETFCLDSDGDFSVSPRDFSQRIERPGALSRSFGPTSIVIWSGLDVQNEAYSSTQASEVLSQMLDRAQATAKPSPD